MFLTLIDELLGEIFLLRITLFYIGMYLIWMHPLEFGRVKDRNMKFKKGKRVLTAQSKNKEGMREKLLFWNLRKRLNPSSVFQIISSF
jgi:hypothetical protein